ncbi:MAG: hypothetical protein RL030_1799, partial [Pseudomonadota bacterium]
MAAGDTKKMANYVEGEVNNTLTAIWSTASAIKVALVTATLTPNNADSFPTWGAGGTQNYSTNEIAATGAYVAGGVTLTGCTVVQTGSQVFLNCNSPLTWAANGASPVNARWAIVYNNTTTNKEVIGYIDLGAV